VKYNTTKYYMPFEPDGDKLRLWLKFNHLGRQIKDYSFFCNNFAQTAVLCQGVPRLCKGPDDGVKGGRIVSRFNAGSESIDYLKLLNPEDVNIGIMAQSLGFSQYFEFMLEGDPVQQGGVDQTLWAHTDDSNGDFATMLQIGTNRQLKFFVRDNANNFDFVSANNKITSGVYHTACITYNPTGNVLGMRIDNQPQTDSGSGSPSFPDPIENSAWIGIAGIDNDIGVGKFVGRYADLRWYRDMIFSGSQMDNIWNNKRSISPIEYGSIDVMGYAKFNTQVFTSGFDPVGYDSTGFDTS
jgi:hypothetical protein